VLVSINLNDTHSANCKLKPTPLAISVRKMLSYDQGIDVTFNYPASITPKEDDWIGIFVNDDNVPLDKGDSNEKHLAFWTYTCNTQSEPCLDPQKSGKVIFDVKDPKIEYYYKWPLPSGRYRACLLNNNKEYDIIGSCKKFSIKLRGKQKKMVKLAKVKLLQTEFKYKDTIRASFNNPAITRNSMVQIYNYTKNFPELAEIRDPLMWVYTGCNNVRGDQTETCNCAKKKKKGIVTFYKGNTGRSKVDWPLSPGRYSMLITFDNNLPYENIKSSSTFFDIKDRNSDDDAVGI